MSSLHQDRLLTIKTSFSPRVSTQNFYPAGSFSSNQNSQYTEDLVSRRSSITENSIDAAKLSDYSLEIIAYEAVSSDIADKSIELDIKTDNKQVKTLTGIIEDLKEKCKSYEKQNQDLRMEMQHASKELIENNRGSLQCELQSCRNKVSFHENMLVKLLALAEDLCEEEHDISKNTVHVDLHSYNYLISKLEIVRYRLNRYASKVQQLENEKNSITDMLNCYITTDKIIDTQKLTVVSSENQTPELLNAMFSRKCSVLTETSENYPYSRLNDEEIYAKKHLSCENFESENINPRNTFTNLKGISNITRSNVIKSKPCSSFSVSPPIPKPKRSVKPSVPKEPVKFSTFKPSKGSSDENSKKKPTNKNYC